MRRALKSGTKFFDSSIGITNPFRWILRPEWKQQVFGPSGIFRLFLHTNNFDDFKTSNAV